MKRAFLLLCLCGSLLIVSACGAPTPLALPPTPTDCPQICAPGGFLPPTDTSLPPAGPALEAPGAPAPETPAASPTPVQAPTATATSQPTATPCSGDLCTVSGALFLQRPIAAPDNDQVDASYRFGSTQDGQRDPHHGVEMLNRFGTTVLAAGDGKVVVAGTDLDPTSAPGAWPITYYGPYMNFYGNLVVIEHQLPETFRQEFPGQAGPLYTLYGHLSEINVQPGQDVQAGQPIGKVGQAGIATGPHLHFEVRWGENSYKASRNPEAWLQPHPDAAGQPLGAIAGRILDPYGEYLEIPGIVLQHLPDGPDSQPDFEITVMTYEEKGLRGQPPFSDSFAIGDLPPGLYRISFPMGGLRRELVQVLPGALTVVTFK